MTALACRQSPQADWRSRVNSHAAFQVFARQHFAVGRFRAGAAGYGQEYRRYLIFAATLSSGSGAVRRGVNQLRPAEHGGTAVAEQCATDDILFTASFPDQLACPSGTTASLPLQFSREALVR